MLTEPFFLLFYLFGGFTFGGCIGGSAFLGPGGRGGGRGGRGGGGGRYPACPSRSGTRNTGAGGYGGGPASTSATPARYAEASKSFFMLKGIWQVIKAAKADEKNPPRQEGSITEL
ncbi:hypothetical protein L873DRAFT_1464597 [Choiromyces venosus 120613-1]|uniref:Uncharacterized protein n=1 Tax=Choiromyces venosus 120613-1 TaxID=1336337 RepID=A0A3N4K4L7_9PEZI|nr:hypothetical protein L873DRAFT_1464597 [Choiromyces venosus 120613-1]